MLQQGTHLSCYKVFEPETPSIREDLVIFLDCDSGITGKALADKVLGFIRNQLDPSKMHGQAYDGAGNMSWNPNGAAARISSQYPLTFTSFAISHFKLGSCGFILGGEHP